jgi:predicted component of type VI protein secretion system
MQAVLVMFRSDGERRSFSITRDVTVIGRREDCDLRIPLHDVSRKHARLVREGDQLRIEDLGSSNGTHLNGQRIERDAVLQAGDSVQVGPVVFVVQVDGMPADEDLHPITAESAATAAMLAPSAVPTPPGVEAPYIAGEALEPLDDMGLEPLEGAAGDEPTVNLSPEEAGHEGGVIEMNPQHDDLSQLETLDEPLEISDDSHQNAGTAGHENLDDLLIDIEPEKKH